MFGISYTELTGKRNFAADLCIHVYDEVIFLSVRRRSPAAMRCDDLQGQDGCSTNNLQLHCDWR